MKVIIATTLALCALSGPASAQRMGMINQNAPSIEQKMDLGKTGVIELSYAGINFGQGNWASTLEDEKRREGMRTRINSTADQAPLGTFSTTKNIKLGETSVQAGEYDLAFKLNDEFEWELSLTSDDAKATVPLELADTEELSKRLVLSVYAGDEDFTGGLYLAFGQRFGMLSITPAAAVSVEKVK